MGVDESRKLKVEKNNQYQDEAFCFFVFTIM